jgi:cytochrome b involved in lipid metabolism
MGATLSNQIEIRRLRHTLPEIFTNDLQRLTDLFPDHIYFFLDDLVIDATQFIRSHPGGENALRNRHMCDITNDYEWHSANGKRMILCYARWRCVDLS